MEKFSQFHRANLEYLEQQQQTFLQNPESLSSDWKHFFEGMEFAQSSFGEGSLSQDEIHVYKLIQHYRDYGHLIAQLDPLKLNPPPQDFSLAEFELNEQHLSQVFQVGSILGLQNATLDQIIKHLKTIYCGTLTPQISGCEPAVRAWFQDEFENPQKKKTLSAEEKKEIFKSLAKTEALEKFIHTRYVGTKRFSIEGGDALLPMLETAVTTGTSLGIEEFVIGMAHRGRINVLANFMDKAIELIFAEFDGTAIDNTGFDGDVKYHLGYSADKKTPHGDCHIALAFNPSHLEAVNPVACGMTRAKQRVHNDTEHRQKVVPILIHGDAAVIGQGVVSETLQLSQLKAYTVGGSLHIIINNQIGFTTNPIDSRSTRYSSDIAKTIKAPVLIVNGDDVEACIRAIDMSIRFRQTFKQDVFIDLICYRRFGHNEGDEPAFTQPRMYDIIHKHPTLMKIYSEQLQQEKVMSSEETGAFYNQKIENLQKILDETRKNPPELKLQSYGGRWSGLRQGKLEDMLKPAKTQFDLKSLKKLATFFTEVPSSIEVHKKIERLIHARKKMVEDNQLDWAMGELMAYATLISEGTPLRLSGQDCKRGTFTHRQAVYFDAHTAEEYSPLKFVNPPTEACIYNSSLSEMAVLGFEYGNALSDPKFLTIWEAQFGDFANGAQIIIDQFLSSSEQKWGRTCGLTLFLPHGFEGQGPEHSSARLERFLQLCAQENMQVCNLSTPANLFHVLRRQMRRDFRKPLVVMTPKSLLRHPMVVSSLEDLAQGQFQEVIEDPRNPDPKKVETLILCSGKLFYDLEKARQELPENPKICIVRVEQLYPFPEVYLAPYINGFSRLKNIIWTQEEPKNMGAWNYVFPILLDLIQKLGLKNVNLNYIGRTHRSSPAVGASKVHVKEQNQIIEQCLGKKL